MQQKSKITSLSDISCLDKMQLNQIFEQVKNMVNSNHSGQFTDQKNSEKKQNIRMICDFVIKKIQNREKLQLKQFIGLISILSYLKIVAKQLGAVSKFKNSFYKNVASYISRVAQFSISCNNPLLENTLKLSLSTLLCALTSLIKQSGSKESDLDSQRLFSPKMVQALLRIQFPNDEKLMRHYRVLVLYLSRMKLTGLSKLLLMKSLSHHLINCQISKHTQITVIYVLNNMLASKNTKNVCAKIQQIWTTQERVDMLKAQIKLLSCVESESQCRIVIQFCGKIVGNMYEGLQNIMDCTQFVNVYNNIYKVIKLSERFNSTLERMVLNLNEKTKFQILKFFGEIENPSITELQIMELSSKSMNEKCLIQIISLNFWQKLMHFFNINKDSIYQKYLLSKIIDNLIKNSQMNQDIKLIIENLTIYGCPSYLFQSAIY